jgi:CubicO group peptidase (beta-lactamase class C family)
MLKERLTRFIFGQGRSLDKLLHAYAELERFSGAALVARGGRVLLHKAYGHADPGTLTPNTVDTAFRIGSLTKPFTAILVMQLVQAGQLELEDTLALYIPDYPNAEHITLRHLLSNTSGIPDYIPLPAYEALMGQATSPEQLVALFRDLPLLFAPGASFGYSNSNWVLLTLILEQVTGKAFATLLHERIFAPAGMTRSGVDWQTIAQPRALGYLDTGAAGVNYAPAVDDSTMLGAGAITATTGDLYRWGQALHSGKLLALDVLNSMFVPGSEQYGLGWELHCIAGRATVGHSGGIPGFVSAYTRFVDEDVTIILLSNLGSAALGEMTDKLAAAVFDEPYELPDKRQFIQLDPAVYAPYLGSYNLTYFGRTSTLTFTVEADRLVMKVSGLPQATLHPLSETTFFARSKGEVEFSFVREPDGTVRRIDVNWAGYDLQATRIG